MTNDPDATPLVDAAFRDDIDTVRELLQHGADVNERDDFNSTDFITR